MDGWHKSVFDHDFRSRWQPAAEMHSLAWQQLCESPTYTGAHAERSPGTMRWLHKLPGQDIESSSLRKAPFIVDVGSSQHSTCVMNCSWGVASHMWPTEVAKRRTPPCHRSVCVCDLQGRVMALAGPQVMDHDVYRQVSATR